MNNVTRETSKGVFYNLYFVAYHLSKKALIFNFHVVGLFYGIS